jgi:Ca-activated chloride channel family protein
MARQVRVRLWVLILLAAGAAEARTVGDRVVSRSEEARAHYEEGRFEDALRAYRDALVERPESERLRLNVGDALFQLQRYEEALQEFERAAASDDPNLAASGLYNKGNTHFQLQDFPAAVEAYQDALQRVPADTDAKANLELALQHIQPPPPSQSGGDNEQDPDGEQEGQQPGTPQPADGDETDEESQAPAAPEAGDRQAAPEAGQEEAEPQSAEPPPSASEGMEEADAEQLLDALRGHEQEAQDRRYRARGRGDDARDW